MESMVRVCRQHAFSSFGIFHSCHFALGITWAPCWCVRSPSRPFACRGDKSLAPLQWEKPESAAMTRGALPRGVVHAEGMKRADDRSEIEINSTQRRNIKQRRRFPEDCLSPGLCRCRTFLGRHKVMQTTQAICIAHVQRCAEWTRRFSLSTRTLALLHDALPMWAHKHLFEGGLANDLSLFLAALRCSGSVHI